MYDNFILLSNITLLKNFPQLQFTKSVYTTLMEKNLFKRFFPIILLTFVNVIGFSLLIPILPAISNQYSPDWMANIVYGTLISSYALFQFLCAPVLGSLSDKYGRKPILLLSQLGTTLSWVVFGLAYFLPEIYFGPFALPLIIILISRVLDGVTGGNISVAQAWISDVTSPQEKTKAFGIIGATFGAGFLIGPGLGGVSASTEWGYLGTAVLALIISLVTLVLMWIRLPESLPEADRDKDLQVDFWTEINVWRKFSQFRPNKFIWYLFLIRLSFALVMGAFVLLIILYMQETLGLDTLSLGYTLSSIGIFSIFNQVLVTPKIATAIGNLKTFYASQVIFFTSLIIVPFLPTEINLFDQNLVLVVFMIVVYFQNLGISMGMPTFKTILVNTLPQNKQGLATGLDESLIALGNSVTPLLAGVLYSLFLDQAILIFSLILLLPHVYVYLKTKRWILLPASNV